VRPTDAELPASAGACRPQAPQMRGFGRGLRTNMTALRPRKVTTRLRTSVHICRSAGRAVYAKPDRTEVRQSQDQSRGKAPPMNANDPHALTTGLHLRELPTGETHLAWLAMSALRKNLRDPAEFVDRVDRPAAARGLSTDRRFRAGRAGRLAGHGGRRISHSSFAVLGFCHVLRRPLDAAHLPPARIRRPAHRLDDRRRPGNSDASSSIWTPASEWTGTTHTGFYLKSA